MCLHVYFKMSFSWKSMLSIAHSSHELTIDVSAPFPPVAVGNELFLGRDERFQNFGEGQTDTLRFGKSKSATSQNQLGVLSILNSLLEKSLMFVLFPFVEHHSTKDLYAACKRALRDLPGYSFSFASNTTAPATKSFPILSLNWIQYPTNYKRFTFRIHNM